jgi:hypothetical protein
MKMTAFWNIVPCSLIEVDRLIALIMEAESTSETSVNFTRLHGVISQNSFIFK